MNWDSIKYIFQIPLSWYRKIHNMVFHAYGTNFLMVREGYYGGMEIGIDNQGFSDAVGQLGYGKVKTVDGIEPDDNGNVSFSLTGGKWLKSDANGHIITSDEDPLSLDDEEEGYLYNNYGTLEYKDEEYVTIDTDQTITGEKTFENVVNISNGTVANDASIQVDNSGKLKIEQGTETIVETPKVTIANSTNTGHIDIDSSVPSLELYGHPNGLGGNIDFHTEGSTVDYTSRIIDSANQFSFLTFDRPIFLYSYYQNTSNATGIMITSANGNYQQLLTNEPARLYSTGSDNQIATRGYTRLNFARATHTHGNISSGGKITASAGATPINYYVAVDQDGNLYKESTSNLDPDLSDYVTSSDLSTTLRDYVTNKALGTTLQDYVTNVSLSTTLSSYATQTWVGSQGYLKSSDLSRYVTSSDLQSTLQGYTTTQSFTTLENTVDSLGDDVTELSADVELLKLDWIKTVDGHSPNSSGAVSFGLTASKWLKSDSNGHIVTTNDTPVTVNSQSKGYIYNNNGTVEYKDDEYVTLNTAQTITANKTFNGADVLVNGGGKVTVSDAPNGGQIELDTAVAGGAYITMLTGTVGNNAEISKTTAGLGIQDTVKVNLNAPANQATLTNHPTDTSTSSKAIATVGYVQSNCVTLDKTQYTPQTGSMTFVTGVSWNGTQLVISRVTITFTNGVATSYTTLANQTIDTVAFSTT